MNKNTEFLMIKEKKLKKYKIKIKNNQDLNNVNKLTYNQINSLGYILSTNGRKNTVNNIVNLAIASRDLNAFLFRWLLLIERQFKAAFESVILEHEEKDGKAHDIFNMKIYHKKHTHNKKSWEKHIAHIVKAIDSFKNKQNQEYKYYMKENGYIPLYLFIDYLSFGTIHRMYNKLKQKIRDEIVQKMKIQDNSMIKLLSILIDARNACAHDELMFNWSVNGFTMPRNIVYSAFGGNVRESLKKEKNGISWKNNIFAIIVCFKYFLPKKQFTAFIEEYKKINKLLSRRLGQTYYYYVLNGGSMGILDRMQKLDSRKLAKYQPVIDMDRSNLIEFVCKETGNAPSYFKKWRKDQILNYLANFEKKKKSLI